MSLEKGAETIVEQCLKISEDEKVVVLNDVNDEALLDSLNRILDEKGIEYDYIKYPEPENHGEEPPAKVAEAMKNSDVFIAPTKKSISHTKARIEANKAGARGATLPGIDKEVWDTSLQADYNHVSDISDTVWDLLKDHETVRITTPSGTDLKLWIDMDYFEKDIGLIHEKGGFGNLPAGEVDGGVIKAEGTLVVDHAAFLPEENEGAVIEIKGTEVVAIKNSGGEIENAFDNVEGTRNIAEFGFGTNPEAKLIGNLLQDEKVLGTVHIAFGDNTSYFPEDHERHNVCEIHWDFVCEEPTVFFGDRKVLDAGEPFFDV